tara:strand:- start:1426 stop:2004 length:579 start_codon:yes stop_codon:yes gene_type:complete
MKKLKNIIPFSLLACLAFSTGCQSGKTVRLDPSQVEEYRDLTIRDLNEFSARMFPNLISNPALQKRSDNLPPLIAIGPMTAKITAEFTESSRIRGLQKVITQSGLARFSSSKSGSPTSDYVSFARSQQGRSVANMPDYLLVQTIEEYREYQKKVLVKTYDYEIKLVDLRTDSPTLGNDLVFESESIVKMVRR